MLSSVAERQSKAIRIIAGTMLMAAFVLYRRQKRTPQV